MIVSIHQPHFFPWLGYFNKALAGDVFVWLHTVQYRKNYYQNRTRIKDESGAAMWLTLPVHAPFGAKIDAVTIADPRWRVKVSKRIEQCYRKAPHFARCWPALSQPLADASDHLDDINFKTFKAVLELLNADSTRIVRAGDLGDDRPDPTERLLAVCKSVGATAYIAGKGGRNYLVTDRFEATGIRVYWQEFDPEGLVYHQLGRPFIPGLSVLDCLFNVGPERTAELVKSAWTPEPRLA
jgi:hypothetical protein